MMSLAAWLLLAAAGVATATGTTKSIRLRSIGWYRIDDPWYGCVPPEEVHWDALTHIAIDGPKIAPDYTASCVLGARENHTMALARQHGVKVIWIIDEAVFPCTWCAAGQTDYNRTEMRNHTRRSAFLRTIGKAAAECGIDGIDGDTRVGTTLRGQVRRAQHQVVEVRSGRAATAMCTRPSSTTSAMRSTPPARRCVCHGCLHTSSRSAQ